MSDKKISELTELTAPDGTEELVVNDSGTSKKITQANLFKLGDNVKANFGAGDDLKVYHSGATGSIENYTGSLVISNASDDYDVIIQSDNGAGSLTDYFRADGSAGSALLYHYGSSKLATTATGVDVTGSVTCDGFTSTGIDDNATSTAITIDASENVGVAGNLVVGAGNGAEPLLQFTNSGRLPGSPGFSFRDDLDTGMYQPLSTAGTICFSANGTEMARINGNGLTFNGDTAAANALDDYETGTWTPVISFSTGTTGITYTEQTGNYIKVGNLVTLYCSVVLSAKGTSTGGVRIANLPFTPVNSAPGVFSMNKNITYSGTLSYYSPATHFGYVYQTTDGGNRSQITQSSFADNSEVMMSMTFRVA
jgi:hypothetical protein